MQPAPQPLSSATRLQEIVDRFAQRDVAALPVIDAQGRYCGIVTANEVERAMREDTFDVTAEGLAEVPAAVSPDTTLERASAQLVRQDTAALPVIDPGSTIVLGWLTHRDILMAYSTHLENRPDV
jgi:CIC family chloride channel protein